MKVVLQSIDILVFVLGIIVDWFWLVLWVVDYFRVQGYYELVLCSIVIFNYIDSIIDKDVLVYLIECFIKVGVIVEVMLFDLYLVKGGIIDMVYELNKKLWLWFFEIIVGLVDKYVLDVEWVVQ